MAQCTISESVNNFSAFRNEDDGCQFIEAAVRGVHFPPVRARDNLPAGRLNVGPASPGKTDQQHNETMGSKNFIDNKKRFQMIMIQCFQKDDPASKQASPNEIQVSRHPDEKEKNITDGGEFLDDAIRMKDQPLEWTSELEYE